MRRLDALFRSCSTPSGAFDLAPISPYMEQICRLHGFGSEALDDPAERARAVYWFVGSFLRDRSPHDVPIPADLIEWLNVPALDLTEYFSVEPVPGGFRRRPCRRYLTRYMVHIWRHIGRDRDIFSPLGYYEFLTWFASEASVDWRLPRTLIPDDLVDLLNQPAISESRPLTVAMYVLSRPQCPERFDSGRSWSREDVLAASCEGLTRLLKASDVRLLPDYVTNFWNARPFPDTPLQSAAESFLTAFEYTVARVHSDQSGVLELFEGFVHQQDLARLWYMNQMEESAPGSMLFSGFTMAGTDPADEEFRPVETPDTAIVVFRDRDLIAGLSRAAQAAVHGLNAAGYEVAELDYSLLRARMGKEAGFNSRFPPFANRQAHIFNLNPEYVPECVAVNLARFHQDDYLIGQFYWELSSLSRVHECGLSMMDEVWVSSEYLRELYSRHTSRPVVNVGQAVVPKRVVGRYDRAHFGLPSHSFLYMVSFDAPSGIVRKNPYGAVLAFQKAFSLGVRDVGLVIKTRNTRRVDNRFDQMEWEKVRKAVAADNRIQVVDSTLSEYELTGLINTCDVSVSLHRSEGFGFGPAEAMALGKPVIVTNYSGVTDFCTTDTAALVAFREIDVPDGSYPLMDSDRTYRWAEPDPDSAVEAFRTLYNDRSLASRIAAAGQQLILAEYSVNALARRYRNRLSQLGFEPTKSPSKVQTLARTR